jgi:hypothetical protein
MKTHTQICSRVAMALGFLLVPAGFAFAQEGRPGAGSLAALGVVLVICLLIGVGLYVYTSLALQTIANKTSTPNGWMAWIPLVNVFLMLSIAKKPWWWFFLCLIPLVNLVILIIVWMAIAEARHKPNWWGILMIVPFVNIVVPGYLAWAD